jgi:hypothetical protein
MKVVRNAATIYRTKIATTAKTVFGKKPTATALNTIHVITATERAFKNGVENAVGTTFSTAFFSRNTKKNGLKNSSFKTNLYEVNFMQQASLFNLAPTQTKSKREIVAEEIKRKSEIVFNRQKDSWKKNVLEFAENEYLPGRKGLFLCEDLREAYEAYARVLGLPQTVEKTAWSGVMRILRNRKLVAAHAPMPRGTNFVYATSYESLV